MKCKNFGYAISLEHREICRGRRLRRPKNDGISTPYRVLISLNILLVGTGVPDGPESNKFCFLNGYWYVATHKANSFSSRTVEDAGPYK